jgi:cell division protein FtsW
MFVSAIFALGLVMIFSTTSADLLDHERDEGLYQPLFKQMSYACAGIFLAWIVARRGLESWLRYSPLLLAFISILLVLVLIPGVGREVNGAKRWLSIAGMSLQPSEFLKFIIPLYIVHAFREKEFLVHSYKECARLLSPLIIPLGLVLLEPNNGTVALILVEIIVLLFVMGVKKRIWAAPILLLVCLGIGAAFLLPYVSGRIDVFLHPEKDLLGRGHQPYQAKIAAGSGALFGKGPGNSWQKLSYLPEAQNDYIAAIYAEEYGFAGILLLISLFMGLSLTMAQIAMGAKDKATLCVFAGVMTVLSIQAFLNLAVVSGLAPSTGLNLPFFSQGGSSLMANLAGLGLLFSSKEHRENSYL